MSSLTHIHPMFVHFPIGLLVVYALMEILSLPFLNRKSYWFYIKGSFAILGALTALVTIPTGLLIKNELAGDDYIARIVNVHAPFAIGTTVVFAIIALSYIGAWKEKEALAQGRYYSSILTRLKRLVLDTPLVIFLALIGLAGIMITGALGATMVYGPNFEPFAAFIYKLFFKN
jgi:uncharacterized membrane protein